MAITEKQAFEFAKGPIGSKIPLVVRYMGPDWWGQATGQYSNYKPYILNKIEEAIKDPVAFTLNNLKGDVSQYVLYKNYPSGGQLAASSAADAQKWLQGDIDFLISQKASISDIKDAVDSGQKSGITALNKDISRKSDQAWYDKVFNVANALMVGGLTGGLGLGPIQQTVLNSALQLAAGAKPEDVLRAAAGTLTAAQIPGYLSQVSALGGLPETAYTALENSLRQVTNAVITKQDPKTAMLAGSAGGAVTGFLASDNAAIARAAGEYTQALAAGMTQEQALNKALSGFVATEQAAAKQKVLDTSAQGQATTTPDTATTADPTKTPVGTGDASVTSSQGNVSSLPPVTVTATADPNQQILDLISTSQTGGAKTGTTSLPEVTVTATADNTASNLSTISSTDGETKTPTKTDTSKTDSILLSLLNRPLDRTYVGGGTTGPTQTASSVGSQALGQALRIGDAGAPIFGGDKEKSKKSGWNVESLRYMGNSEV